MTVPFTEPVQNFTEFSLWEILDIKKANFSVQSFDILDDAYEKTPLKFAERIIVQLGSEPKRIRYYDESANFTEDDYYPSNNPDAYVKVHSNAELNSLMCAYEGKYGDDSVYEPVKLKQDVNGWTQLEFTTNMLFKSKN